VREGFHPWPSFFSANQTGARPTAARFTRRAGGSGGRLGTPIPLKVWDLKPVHLFFPPAVAAVLGGGDAALRNRWATLANVPGYEIASPATDGR